VTPHVLLGSGAINWLAAGVLSASDPSMGGTDFAGIATLVTAISGLVATVGAIIIGLRKKTDSDKLLELLLKQYEGDKEDDGDS
jgi:ammonia channel protein AmtB